MQAAKKLSDQWNLTRIGEDPAIDWMADVSHYIFKIFSEGKGYEQCKFSRERFIILYLHKFGCLLGVDHTHTNPSLYGQVLSLSLSHSLPLLCNLKKRDWREFCLPAIQLQRFFLRTNAHHVIKGPIIRLQL